MRKPGSLILKDSSADEPRGVDWTKWLAGLGSTVTISTSTWTIVPSVTGDSTLTSHDPSIVPGGRQTQCYFTGGTAGRKYTITNHIVTNSVPAVTDERSFQYLITER